MTSKMLEEALSSFEAVQAQLQQLDAPMIEIAGRLRRQPPQVAMTVARGSSDHAASYFAYLTMQQLGVPVASLPMSVVTMQQAPLKVSGQVAFAFSQSGQSPDLVNSLRLLRKRGALSVSMVNAADSPLEAACEFSLPLLAGTESSVAATKSFIATLSASARLIAHWKEDSELLQAHDALPAGLREAAKQDWSVAIEALRDCERLMVIGRGAGFAIASGSRAEVQGNLGDSGRSVQQCRSASRPDGTDRRTLSAAGFRPTRRRAGRPAEPGGGNAPARRPGLARRAG